MSKYPKKEVFEVSVFEAMYSFYLSLLTGDPTDNIEGVPGIGPKRAEKILKDCETEEEMYEKVFMEYDLKFGSIPTTKESLDVVDSILTENAHLLYIQREEGKLWSIPEC